MTTLSLITALDPVRAQFLAETATSVHAATTYLSGQGVEVDWFLVVDGPGALPRFRGGERTTLVRLPERAGIAAARNVGLFSSRAEWVGALDADDTLNGAGLADALARHAGRSRVTLPGLPHTATGDVDGPAWVVTGHLVHDGAAPEPGLGQPVPLEPGQLANAWTTGWPLAAGNVLTRRAAALGVGGWPALPIGEDVGFLLALSEQFPGVFDPVPVWRRRSWEGQYSRSVAADEVASRAAWGTAAWLNAQRAHLFAHRPPVTAPQGR